jgi:hypothetical protein
VKVTVSGLSWAWCHTPIIPGGQAILGYIVRPCPPCPQKKQGTKKHQYRTYRYKNNEELMQTALCNLYKFRKMNFLEKI